MASAKVSRWLAEGEFDILHVHEPIVPSLGMLALWQAKVPTVGRSTAPRTTRVPCTSSRPPCSPARTPRRPHRGVRRGTPHGGRPPGRGRVRHPQRRVRRRLPRRPAEAGVGGTTPRGRRAHDRLPGTAGRTPQGPPRVRGSHPGGAQHGSRRPFPHRRARRRDGRARPPSPSTPGRVPGRHQRGGEGALFASADVYVAPQTGGESFGKSSSSRPWRAVPSSSPPASPPSGP